ncbi:MAG: glycoside hydrolase family 3 protein [Defluviitaleaceae bacterium]|nr:glycoside hydrolase family 3 protein [Defluviitaleaceae bacterium]
MLANMSLEEKIGQLFLVMINGPELSTDYQEHFIATKIGNYILFAKDLTDYKSIRRLTDSLQKTAKQACRIPAFISADQEGGMVTRIFSGATHFPSNMAITASGKIDSMEQLGEMMGIELHALGININHAPVLDVNNNSENPVIGVRAYSDNPAVVAKMGAGYGMGLQKSGVIASGKHFPGHGDTSMDSHLELPTVRHDINRLESIEFLPFKAAIEGGIDSLMTAHICFKAMDPDIPATLSEKIITGFLREKLGFEGLIITDCMTMNAIKKRYTTEKGCVMALNAGIDLLCLNASKEIQAACYNTVLTAVKSGEIPMKKIDAAITRILRYKHKYEIGRVAKMPREYYPKHEALADEISEKSITLTHDTKKLLPLIGKRFLCISPPPVRTSIADDTVTTMEPFCKQVAAKLGNPYREISINPDTKEIESVLDEAKDYSIILYGCYSAKVNPGQVHLFKALKAEGKDIVLVSLRIPYDIVEMKEADCHIAAFEYTNRAVCNVMKVLAGKKKPVGVMPVIILPKE